MFPTINKGLAKSLASLIIAIAAMTPAVFADDIELKVPQSTEASVTLALSEGTISDPADVLQVFVGTAQDCCEDRIPVAGRYTFENSVLSFTPAFEFSANQDYVVRLQKDQNEALTSFRIAPETEPVPAAVTAIYPNGDVLPENILRFYIHFAVPMKSGVAFDYIKLRDANGIEDEAAFMRFKQELWNEDRTRLTILLDPGRIKRNVATNLELGPALKKDEHYSLVVEAGWPAADGSSTLPAFSKTFLVSDALRSLPDVESWNISTPCIDSQDTLEIKFDRPFDRHQLTNSIWLADDEMRIVPTTIEIGDDELSIQFLPDKSWSHYFPQLVVRATLEDVAANNFRDLLDHQAEDDSDDEDIIITQLPLQNCES